MNRATALKRAKLRSQILSLDPNAVPFYGPTPTPYAAVGEAPGRVELKKGRPFVGPAGKLLRGLMEQNDLDPDRFFWTNCVPYLSEHVTPTPSEVSRHRPLLDRQLLLADPKLVLVVGGVALSAFLGPDFKITTMRGKPFWRNGRIMFPIFHPAGALRDQGKVAYIRDDLAQFKAITVVGEGLDFDIWAETCVRCKREVEVYNDDGIPFCEEHVPTAGRVHEQYQFKEMAEQ